MSESPSSKSITESESKKIEETTKEQTTKVSTLQKAKESIEKMKVSTVKKAMGYIQKIKNYFSKPLPKFTLCYVLVLTITSITIYLTSIMIDTSVSVIVEYLIIIMQYAYIFIVAYAFMQMFSSDIEHMKYFIGFIILTFLFMTILSKAIENDKDGKLKGSTNTGTIINKSLVIFAVSTGFGMLLSMMIKIYKYIYKEKPEKYNKVEVLIMAFSDKMMSTSFAALATFFWIAFIIFPIHNSLSTMNFLGKILSPLIIGYLVILFLIVFILYIAKRLKLITKISLNGMISVTSIVVLFVFVYWYIFISSFNSACKDLENGNQPEDKKKAALRRYLTLGIIGSILYIVIYDDVKKWRRNGSMLFVAVTIFLIYCLAYYWSMFPKMSMFVLWFFIEWIILIFRRKENCKMAFNNIFMIHHS